MTHFGAVNVGACDCGVVPVAGVVVSADAVCAEADAVVASCMAKAWDIGTPLTLPARPRTRLGPGGWRPKRRCRAWCTRAVRRVRHRRCSGHREVEGHVKPYIDFDADADVDIEGAHIYRVSGAGVHIVQVQHDDCVRGVLHVYLLANAHSRRAAHDRI